MKDSNLIDISNRLEQYTSDHHAVNHLFSDFVQKYASKHNRSTKNKVEVFDRYISLFYEQPIKNFEKILADSCIEDRIKHFVDRGNKTMTNEWLETYEDLVTGYSTVPKLSYDFMISKYLEKKNEVDNIFKN